MRGRWRGLWRLVGLIGTLFPILAGGSAAYAAESGEFEKFLASYRCPIIEILRFLHASKADAHRFLILSSESLVEAYVQCLFLPDRQHALCEASSGYYQGASSLWRPSASALARLAALGFDTKETAGNHQLMFDIDDTTDETAIADVMLRAVYAYGARAGTLEWKNGLEFTPATSCVAVS